MCPASSWPARTPPRRGTQLVLCGNFPCSPVQPGRGALPTRVACTTLLTPLGDFLMGRAPLGAGIGGSSPSTWPDRSPMRQVMISEPPTADHREESRTERTESLFTCRISTPRALGRPAGSWRPPLAVFGVGGVSADSPCLLHQDPALVAALWADAVASPDAPCVGVVQGAACREKSRAGPRGWLAG